MPLSTNDLTTQRFARYPAGLLATIGLKQASLHDDLPSAGASQCLLCVHTRRVRVELCIEALSKNATLTLTCKAADGDTLDTPSYLTRPVDLDDNLIVSLQAATWSARESSDGMHDLGKISDGDPIATLSGKLLNKLDGTEAVQALYAQSLSLTIAARVLSSDRRDREVPNARSVAPLPKWRVKRVSEFVDANLPKKITLQDMAATAGLTPMYFAAQFRAAMNMRPHDYVLKRRIQYAQERLADSSDRLVDIALDSGFLTQAHFTTVFGKFVGTTPHRWREIAQGRRLRA